MKFTYKRALVTGGAGFIGSHLVEALLETGCRVRVLDNLSTGNPANLHRVMSSVRFIEGDITDEDRLAAAVDGCDVVFHEAAVVSVTQTVDDPVASCRVNDLGTVMVLEAARRHKVQRVVTASSCAVYGDGPSLPKDEGMRPEPLSPYALQKLTGEYSGRLYRRLYGLPTVSLRYFNVFGPRQDPSSAYSGVISIFMTKALNDSRPVIFGDGGQSRDFIFVRDVVRANLLAAVSAEAPGRVFNVGTGRSVTINQLWSTIRKVSGCSRDPVYEAARPGDVRDSRAATASAEKMLRFTAGVTLENGLKETLDWYRVHGPG